MKCLCYMMAGDVLCGNGSEHLGILQEWFGIHWWNSRAFSIFLVVVFVMLPLVLYRRVESLWWSSAIAVLLAVVFVGICIGMAIYALVKGETQTPRMLPELDGSASFIQLFTAVPVIVSAFTFHFNVHPIGIELGKPSTMATAVKISLVLSAGLYFMIGIFGYLLFGESINADILVNFDRTSSSSGVSALLNDVIRLSYAVHLVLVFPLLNYSLRATIDELLFPKKPHLNTDKIRFVSLSVFLLALSYVAAMVIPSIWYIFQFMGSTSAVCLAFIFPGAIALRDIHGISTKKDKIIATIMIVQAIITSCLAIYTNVYNLFSGTTS
nr:probable sodium-coupled neutral amino acid transporter 6 [Ipomoea batatas]